MEGIGYLGGHSLQELMHVEMQGTIHALTRSRRPNLTVTVPELNAFTLGQLFMLYEIQTLFAGGLYRINPLDQPGVEAGKHAAYALLGRQAYADLREEIQGGAEKRQEKYVLA